ncbi:MAG: type II toxin-antitoxin system VapB family antitoxin [Rhodospirillaceae bacterium]|nr:type II toxin-antitoxin system VapB family antitoxin [Rhodospirillaceae bacterium]
MAVSIKTEQADRLAQQLSALTGESMTEAVTRSLAERLDRVRKKTGRRRTGVAAALMREAAKFREKYNPPRLTKADFDRLWGE